VAVTFTTDDGRPATALDVTTDLTSLPAGWTSSASTFTCSGINAGTTDCVLPLTFTPTAAANGSLALAYKYNNDAGESKTGTVNIPYVATTNNNVDATASLNSLSVLTGSTTPITVTFVTDDGNPASALTVTGLSPLPAGWSSGSSTFTCASVSTGTGCQISLGYAPTAADSGNLTLTFSYTNNSGTTKTGNIMIPYVATVPPPPGP
jgi:hypothetical protein